MVSAHQRRVAGVVRRWVLGVLVLIVLLAVGLGTERAWAVPAMVVAGRGHSVMVLEDGSLWAWGYNWYGQVGDGTTTYSARSDN